MRPPVSDHDTLARSEESSSGDSDHIWLELDDVSTEWTEIRELPSEVATAIRETAANLEELDAYALIGVEQDAEWSDIERAYRNRLATFHPGRWSGYHLRDLGPSMDRVVERISFAFAFLADEAARQSSTPVAEELDRPTRPTDLGSHDLDLSGDRPTFPTSQMQPIVKVVEGTRARPPRPPPRKIA